MGLQPDSLGSQSSFHLSAGTFDMLTSVDLVSLPIQWGNCVPGRVIIRLVMKVKCLIKDVFCSRKLVRI